MDIRLRGVSVRFPGRADLAVRGVSVDIAAGERVALLGPSGAGKSTLLRALLGAVALAAGSVAVDGGDPHRDRSARRAIRAGTGFLRQGTDLVPYLSARTNALLGTVAGWSLVDWLAVATGRMPARHRRRLTDLAAVHTIENLLPVSVERLSGGERQRVALVRALLGRPRLVLADEPTTALDPVTAAAAVDALSDVDGATVIVCTHDLAVARRFPRVLALRAGELVYDGRGFDEAAARLVYHDRVAAP